jgi:hypothetical protein
MFGAKIAILGVICYGLGITSFGRRRIFSTPGESHVGGCGDSSSCRLQLRKDTASFLPVYLQILGHILLLRENT